MNFSPAHKYRKYVEILLSNFLMSCHDAHAVKGVNCLCPLEHWGLGFESHSRHGCLRAFVLCLCYLVCAGSDLATGWSLVQRVLPTVYRITKLKNKKATRAKQMAVEQLMNKLYNDDIPVYVINWRWHSLESVIDWVCHSIEPYLHCIYYNLINSNFS
jgi:hypothetical protein